MTEMQCVRQMTGILPENNISVTIGAATVTLLAEVVVVVFVTPPVVFVLELLCSSPLLSIAWKRPVVSTIKIIKLANPKIINSEMTLKSIRL
jgi:hypothetical protein